MSDVTCQVIRTSGGFLNLEAPYRDLLVRSSRATVYDSWEWLNRWWQVFQGPTVKLHVMAFLRDDILIGCAPLVIRRPGLLPVRRLEPFGVLRSDYLDIVYADGCEEQVLSAFENHLHHSRAWDLLDLQQVREDSPTLAYFRRRQSHLNCTIRQQETCPYAPLPDRWETFLAGLGKKNRYNVGYYRRLLERDFRMEIGRVERQQLPEAMEDLFRLHQARWRKRRLPGALYQASVRRFHQEVASDLLDSGMLDLYRLAVDNRVVAMLYCFAYGGRGYYYLGGFDPEIARYSVGTVLTAYAIQQSISRGDTVFDFLRGAEPYKYRWNVREQHNFRIEWRRGSIGSHALYGLNEITRKIEHEVKRIAHRMEGHDEHHPTP